MKVSTREVGYGHPTFVIAEACSNITRWLDPPALDTFVKSVSQTGSNAIKLQLFKAEHFPEAEWNSKRKVEFPRTRLAEFAGLCREYKLLWGASVFDDEAVDLCVEHGADFLKMATREWENQNLWQKVLEQNLPLFASFDWARDGYFPDKSNNTIYLACVPQYPAFDFELPSALYIDEYEDEWGWSSHYGTPDSLDCLIAVSRGACVVERHYRLSASDYEAGWSLDRVEFTHMVENIRRTERMR